MSHAQPPPTPDYTTEGIRALFNEMAATYGRVNLVSSLGFCVRWRRQCAAAIDIRPGDRVLDMMAGMGELAVHCLPRIGDPARVELLDVSDEMCRRADATYRRRTGRPPVIHQVDALDNGLGDERYDCIVSTFGIKTMSAPQQGRLAAEVARLLRPGGRFAFLEISEPSAPVLSPLYRIYLRDVIPVVGRAFLGNPDNYRRLWVYTTAFKNASAFAGLLRDAGLTATMRNLFFGCATVVTGCKASDGKWVRPA